MAGEWREVALASVAVISSGKRPARVLKEAASDCQIPVIGGGGPSGYTDSALYDGGVLITGRVGTLGKLFAPTGPCWPSDNALVVRPNNAETDPRFLRYALQHVIGEAAGMNRGAANPLITQGDLGRLRIGHPPLAEQIAIAHILGTLDDKIELNRRMSETLEAMARALFKSWFVDFDPVRAKMEGRLPASAGQAGWQRGQSLPGLPAHLYDLFPARLVDSELGEIPEGWECGTFGDVVEQLRETETPLESPDVVFHHFSIPAYDEGQWPIQEAGESIKSLKSRVPAGAVLLSKLNPEIERVWLVDVQPEARAICSTEFLVLVPRPPHGRSYVYCLARSPSFRQELEGLVTGTSKSHQRAQASAILALRVIRPPDPLLKRFEQAAEPILARTLECRRESRTLAALRDALLPKLISGELRVRDAERFLKERGL
ncbi:MAG: restriction endonuclease subunit S [Bryobacteraceae bacterium]